MSSHKDGSCFSSARNGHGWKALCQQTLHRLLLRSCLIVASLIRRHSVQGVISLPCLLLCSSDAAKGAEGEAQEQAGAGQGTCMAESARTARPGRGDLM